MKKSTWICLYFVVTSLSCLLSLALFSPKNKQETKTTTKAEENSNISPDTDNRLKTGSKPYAAIYGKDKTGINTISFKTSKGSDYIVIIKTESSEEVIGHVYIRGGETASLHIPNGKYNVFFYTGLDWNPNKQKDVVIGGFEEMEHIQKDGPISIYNQNAQYTLYPVQNGNLVLQEAEETDAF